MVDEAVICDASVLAAIVFGEPRSAEALALTRSRRLLAPTLLPYEMAQTAVAKCGCRPADASRITRAFTESLRVSIRLLAPSWPAVVQVAQENGLSAYDASYLHLALALRVPLATFDVRLATTARAWGILASPGECERRTQGA